MKYISSKYREIQNRVILDVYRYTGGTRDKRLGFRLVKLYVVTTNYSAVDCAVKTHSERTLFLPVFIFTTILNKTTTLPERKFYLKKQEKTKKIRKQN